jgi:pantoate--beta-alanine ligase
MKIVSDASLLLHGCAFVPTMGALHAGHQSLFLRAAQGNENVLASIFINPLQFENTSDLENYPKTPERDIELAQAAGVTELWFPQYDELFPAGFATKTAGALGEIYEGKARPGHFDGVLTVVDRLFQLAKPKSAIFGEKDFQQLSLIRTIAGDVAIVAAPTIRESDGLAMSSRNVRLSQEDRIAALIIYKALVAAESAVEIEVVRNLMISTLANEPRFTLDYAEIIDEKDFSLVNSETAHARAIISGWINGIRLIDNMPMRNLSVGGLS